MRRNAFAMAEDPDSYAGNYEFQVPIFVLTHRIPDKHPRETDDLTFTFVTEGIGSAIEQAQAAAGNQDVTIIDGASVAQQCLKAGLVDELQIDVMPVLLGDGLRLFEGVGALGLQRVKVMELAAGRTHLRFRILRQEKEIL